MKRIYITRLKALWVFPQRSIGKIILDKNGVFHQYREYDSQHRVIFEIGYHHEPKLGTGNVLHVHIHNQPGVENHNSATKEKIYPGHPIYEKYKHFFKGVK